MISQFTSLHHLNLFLHMGLPYNDDSNIYPYFFKNGYKLKHISFKIPVPDTRKKITQNKNIPVNMHVVPEIVFENEEKKQALLLECKLKEIDDDNDCRDLKQALGYLCLDNNSVSNFLGYPLSAPFKLSVEYSTWDHLIPEFEKVLDKYTNIVNSLTGSSMKYNVSGIKLIGDEVFYKAPGSNNVLKKITSNDFLLLIPIDPDIDFKNVSGREIIHENLRIVLAQRICSSIGVTDIFFNIEDVCCDLIPIWDMWDMQSRKKIRTLIKSLINKIIGDLTKKGLEIVKNHGSYIIEDCSLDVAEKVKRYFLSNRLNVVLEEELNGAYGQMTLDDYND